MNSTATLVLRIYLSCFSVLSLHLSVYAYFNHLRFIIPFALMSAGLLALFTLGSFLRDRYRLRQEEMAIEDDSAALSPEEMISTELLTAA